MSFPKSQQLCILCQACCKYITVRADGEFKELAEVRGISIKDGEALLHMPCQYLTEEGCSIYGTGKRAALCRAMKADLKNDICYKGIQEIMKEK
jgi:hypothetical protein